MSRVVAERFWRRGAAETNARSLAARSRRGPEMAKTAILAAVRRDDFFLALFFVFPPFCDLFLGPSEKK